MTRHMSIDIETLDVEKDAAVIAIGAVIFSLDSDEVETFEVQIDPSLAPGMRNRSTWEWWLSQDRKVRERMLSGTVVPWVASLRFAAFCTLDVDYFWGYPARFDVGHLRSLFHAVGQEFPFPFYKERDLSTLKHAVPGVKEELKAIKKANPGAHDALQDAIAQAEMIKVLLKELNLE